MQAKDYKEKIMEMLNDINSEKFLKMIFGFVSGVAGENH